MIRLDTSSADFWSQLQAHTAWEESANQSLTTAVSSIIADVRARGDAAVIEYTNRFDRQTISDASQLEIPRSAWLAALEQIPEKQVEALQFAADRVRMYAEHQRLQSWSYTEADGTILGQRVTALDRVGLYAPGGKAAYPSSVIMNAIPAKVAGVCELILVSPTPDGTVNPLVLAAAAIVNVDRVFCIGGAQAVAALAYGTQAIPAVDKIVGPGNSYVATAKRLVFGKVGIDMIAGPSEVLVIADSGANPDWVAMDLFAQAEHDELAQSILVSADATVLQRVAESIERLLPQMERRDIISVALKNRGLMILAKSWDECCEIANFVAPEHLELAVHNAGELAERIRHAGAMFLGHYSAEVLGDYCAGPNHVLPTARTARFASPLGVYDFQKRTSLIENSRAGAAQLAGVAATLAYGEGLTAHARSAEYRGLGESGGE